MNNGAYASADGQSRRHSCWGAAERKPWSIYEIAAVLGGFVAFWPIGLAALFLKYKNGEIWRGASDMQAPWSQWKSPRDAAEHFSKTYSGWKGRQWSGFAETGNDAFDEYRKAKIEELEALRRKLDAERQAFDDFLAKLRKAKDRDDFERFMAERSAATQSNG